MNTTTLHYIYDALCSQRYGTAPLVKALSDVLPVLARGN
jgi:protein-disulfide isomerase-like protein with CxxC motif